MFKISILFILVALSTEQSKWQNKIKNLSDAAASSRFLSK